MKKRRPHIQVVRESRAEMLEARRREQSLQIARLEDARQRRAADRAVEGFSKAGRSE